MSSANAGSAASSGESRSHFTVGGRAPFVVCRAKRSASCMRHWLSPRGRRTSTGADSISPFSPRRRKKPLVIRFSELRFEPLLFGTDTTMPVPRKRRKYLSGSRHWDLAFFLVIRDGQKSGRVSSLPPCLLLIFTEHFKKSS